MTKPSLFPRPLVIIMTALLLLWPLALQAAPTLPSSFYGTVQLDGANVPDGTVVSAWINGQKYAQTITFTDNGLSVYVLDVPGDDPETSGTVEGGVAGDTVVFYIGNVQATPTATWQNGSNQAVNLSASSAPGLSVRLPTDAQGVIHSVVQIPVTLEGTADGLNVLSFQGALTYDPAVLTFQGLVTAGALTNNWSVETNASGSGQVQLAGYSTSPLAGSGTLFLLKFQVGDTGNVQSSLALSNFRFNEGEPAATVHDGLFTALALGLSGRISYLFDGAAVPGVTLQLSGPVTDSAPSDNAGLFLLQPSRAGDYVLRPSKSGDLRGAISGLDAAWSLEATVGKRTLDANQQKVADVSGNSEVTAYDAALIARHVVGLSDADSLAGVWAFEPSERSYTGLNQTLGDQDFTAVLYGDVTGNWGGSPARAQERIALALTVGSAQGLSGSQVETPVSLTDMDQAAVQAVYFELVYDPSVATFQSGALSPALGSDWQAAFNEREPGVVAVVLYGATPITTDGELFRSTFRLDGAPGSSSSLTARGVRFNEDPPLPQGANAGILQVLDGYRTFLPAVLDHGPMQRIEGSAGLEWRIHLPLMGR